MKTLVIAILSALAFTTVGYAKGNRQGALENTQDLFASVTPDRLLGKTTRRQWLDLYPVNARLYWAAWDCRGRPCDSRERAHIREIAKLVARTSKDPKPFPSAIARTDR